MTQEDVADQLKITSAALSRIESGRTTPKFSRLPDIAKVLGCTVSDLFQEEIAKPESMLAGVAEMMKPLPPEARVDLIHVFVQLVMAFKKNVGNKQ